MIIINVEIDLSFGKELESIFLGINIVRNEIMRPL